MCQLMCMRDSSLYVFASRGHARAYLCAILQMQYLISSLSHWC